MIELISKQGYKRAQSLASELTTASKFESIRKSIQDAWNEIRQAMEDMIEPIKQMFNDIKELLFKEDNDISYTWHVPMDTTIKSQFYVPVKRHYKARSGI